MALGQAHNAYLGFVTQSTLGTLATRTKFLDIVSSSLSAQLTRSHSAALGSPSSRVYTETRAQSGGSVVVEGNFAGIDTLLYHAMGAKASAQQAATAAYKHTLTLAAALPSPGLSVEVAEDVTAFFYDACKINGLTFTQEADYLRLAFDFLGRQQTNGSATSPTFPTSLPIHLSQFAFTIDGSAATINRFSLKIDNALGQRAQLGSVAPKEIVRTGKRQITGAFELDFADTTEYAKFMANTSTALVATWTGANIASTYYYTLKLTMPLCKYEGATPPVSGRGPLTIPVTFVALEQTRGAQDELTIELTNTATSIT